MNCVRRWLLLVMVAGVTVYGQTGAPKPSSTETTAQLVKVAPEIEELKKLSGDPAADRWRILWLHQQITEKVTAAAFEVDATMAQIDNEIARANEVRGLFCDWRGRAGS